MTEEDLANHDLLQSARVGNAKGVASALQRGALVEARKYVVMRPDVDFDPVDVSHSAPFEDEEYDAVGMTALMYAAQSGAECCISHLLDHRAHVNAVEEDLWTPLHFAAKEGHLAVCEKLLASRANPHALNSNDQTPLKL